MKYQNANPNIAIAAIPPTTPPTIAPVLLLLLLLLFEDDDEMGDGDADAVVVAEMVTAAAG